MVQTTEIDSSQVSGGGAADPTQTPTDTLNSREEILFQSSLANELRVLYHDLISKTVVDITINNSVHVNVQLIASEENARRELKPFETLLTIADGSVLGSVLSQIQRDVVYRTAGDAVDWKSPGYLDVLYSANPMSTFEELGVKLELTMEEMEGIVTGICTSGLGRVINSVTSSTVYQRNHKFNIESASIACRVFASTFSMSIGQNIDSSVHSIESSQTSSGRRRRTESAQRMSAESLHYSGTSLDAIVSSLYVKSCDSLADNRDFLESILSLFDGIKSVDEVIAKLPSNLRDYGLDIIIWLLRWKIITEVETFLYNMADFGVDVNVCFISMSTLISYICLMLIIFLFERPIEFAA